MKQTPKGSMDGTNKEEEPKNSVNSAKKPLYQENKQKNKQEGKKASNKQNNKEKGKFNIWKLALFGGVLYLVFHFGLLAFGIYSIRDKVQIIDVKSAKQALPATQNLPSQKYQANQINQSKQDNHHNHYNDGDGDGDLFSGDSLTYGGLMKFFIAKYLLPNQMGQDHLPETGVFGNFLTSLYLANNADYEEAYQDILHSYKYLQNEPKIDAKKLVEDKLMLEIATERWKQATQTLQGNFNIGESLHYKNFVEYFLLSEASSLLSNSHSLPDDAVIPKGVFSEYALFTKYFQSLNQYYQGNFQEAANMIKDNVKPAEIPLISNYLSYLSYKMGETEQAKNILSHYDIKHFSFSGYLYSLRNRAMMQKILDIGEITANQKEFFQQNYPKINIDIYLQSYEEYSDDADDYVSDEDAVINHLSAEILLYFYDFLSIIKNHSKSKNYSDSIKNIVVLKMIKYLDDGKSEYVKYLEALQYLKVSQYEKAAKILLDFGSDSAFYHAALSEYAFNIAPKLQQEKQAELVLKKGFKATNSAKFLLDIVNFYLIEEKPELALQNLQKLSPFIKSREESEEFMNMLHMKTASNKQEIIEYYYKLGVVHIELDNFAEAEENFNKALQLAPKNPYILNYLGYSYLEENININKAFNMLKIAVHQMPNSGAILDSYGWALYKMGEYEDALLFIQKAIEKEPTDATIHRHLGDVYEKLGKKQMAKYQWQKADKFKSLFGNESD